MLGLGVLIRCSGAVSARTSTRWCRRRLVARPGRRHRSARARVVAYAVAQTVGGILGCLLANAMYDVAGAPLDQGPDRRRLWLGEVVATAGLVALVIVLARTGRLALAAPAVGAYIGAAYWFTSSTSFANPAVTVGRDVLRHVRRHRAVVGAGVRARAAGRCRGRRRAGRHPLPEGSPP